MKIIIKILLTINFLGIGIESFAIIANPIISRGKSVFTSSGNAPFLVDNKFGGTTFSVSNNSWIAINVGKGPAKIFFTWNNPTYTWLQPPAIRNCTQAFSVPVNYSFQTSTNSTNGYDGTWVNVPEVTVTGNEATARGHAVEFLNASWVKMNIMVGGGTMDEIEVFDLSSESRDLWFFPGTSISANSFKGTPPSKNFADLINNAIPAFTPAMVRGGIPCITSADFVSNLSNYIAFAGNLKYWAIELGTNDGYNNGNSNVATFKSNLQKIIDACKGAGIEPIIARTLSTNQTAAGWQIHSDYLKAVDDLTLQNNLIPGPDFYTYFLAHPAELDKDGIHPIATGAASIQRLWAEKMTAVYLTTKVQSENKVGLIKISPNPASQGDIKIQIPMSDEPTCIQIFNQGGVEVFKQNTSFQQIQIDSLLHPGAYTVKISNSKFTSSEKLIIK